MKLTLLLTWHWSSLLVAEHLKSRRFIYVAGMQASRSAATYLNYISGMASGQFKLVGRSGGIIADDITDLDAKDALIAIAVQPCARTTVEATIVAQERGALVLAITDSPISPISIHANHVMLVPTRSPMFFESYIGIIAVLELLIGFYTTRKSDSVVSRIQRIESDRHRLREYWKD